jgi:putative salt-induced outer membrane protein YdiY
VIAALIVCAASRAEAQIVNVQSLVGAKTPEGFSGQVDLSADWRTGNTQFLILSGAATVRYKHKKDLVFAIVKGDYGRTGVGATASTFIKKTFEHVRYRHTINDWLTGEAFVQNEADLFRRLAIRFVTGLGPRFTLLNTSGFAVAYGIAYMFEYDKINDTPGPMITDAGRTFSEHRISTYAVGNYALNDKVVIGETVYFQPRVDAFSDFRLLSEFSLVSKISNHLAAKTAFVVAYDKTPPDTIKQLDTSLQAGITVAW